MKPQMVVEIVPFPEDLLTARVITLHNKKIPQCPRILVPVDMKISARWNHMTFHLFTKSLVVNKLFCEILAINDLDVFARLWDLISNNVIGDATSLKVFLFWIFVTLTLLL